MGKLHERYLEITKGTYHNYLMMVVRKEHYFHDNSIAIELEELFQFFNLDALDKFVVSSYYL
jgi:hypothetical protein